jgi:hypothetical protein
MMIKRSKHNYLIFLLLFVIFISCFSIYVSPHSFHFKSLRRSYFEPNTVDEEVLMSYDALEINHDQVRHIPTSTADSPLIVVLAVHLFRSSRAKWVLKSWAFPRFVTLQNGGNIVGYIRVETIYFDESLEFNDLRRKKSFLSRNLALNSNTSAAFRTGELLRHTVDKFPEALWIVKADDDCIVHVGRLLRTLLARNSSIPMIVGHKAPLMWGDYRFVSGGAGFALSSAAVSALVPRLPDCTKLGIDAEDVMISKCLKDVLGFGESVISDDEGFNWGTPEQMLNSESYNISHVFVPPITHHYISPERADIFLNPLFPKTITHVWPYTDLPSGVSISGKSSLGAREVFSKVNCTGQPSETQLAAIESCRTAALSIGFEYTLVQSVDPEGCGDIVTSLRVLYEKGGIVLPLSSNCSDSLKLIALLSAAKERGESVSKTTLDDPSIWALGSPNHGLALTYNDSSIDHQPSSWASSQYNHDIVRFLSGLSLQVPSIRLTGGAASPLISLSRQLNVPFTILPTTWQPIVRESTCVDFTSESTGYNPQSNLFRKSTLRSFNSNQFVTVWLRGGLGNQLFMVSAALAYAMVHSRCLVLPNEELNPHRRSRPYSESVLRAFWIDTTNLGPLTESSGLKVERISEVNAYGYEILRSSSESLVRLEGYFQNYQYHIGHRSQLRQLLGPSNTVYEMIKLKYPDLLHSGIAIHVRRGDFLKWNDLYPIPSTQYYSASINEFSNLWTRKSQQSQTKNTSVNSLSPHPPTFFIFSNDFEWVRGQSLFSSLPGNVVLVTDEDEVMSFYMMILSRYGIICANSSYCWWAAFLMESSKKVIFPSRWYERSDTNTSGIYFPGVITLSST